MEAKYLKGKPINGKLNVVVKVLEHENITVFNDSFQIDENDYSQSKELEFQKREFGYVDATQEEFDEFSKKTTEYINRVLSA